VTNTQVLWVPKHEVRCDICSQLSLHVRTFSSQLEKTKFCFSCWKEFLDECNVSINEPWAIRVENLWDLDTVIIIRFLGKNYGNTQRVGNWN